MAATLRAEPKVALLLLRRMVDPLTLSNPEVALAKFIEWATSTIPAFLKGLVPIQVMAFPTGPTPDGSRISASSLRAELAGPRATRYCFASNLIVSKIICAGTMTATAKFSPLGPCAVCTTNPVTRLSTRPSCTFVPISRFTKLT